MVAEYLKKRLNTALPSNLSFWRDRSGHEVDLLVSEGGSICPVEIKSGATVSQDALRGLKHGRELAGEESGRPYMIYGGNETQYRTDIDILPWNAL